MKHRSTAIHGRLVTADLGEGLAHRGLVGFGGELEEVLAIVLMGCSFPCSWSSAFCTWSLTGLHGSGIFSLCRLLLRQLEHSAEPLGEGLVLPLADARSCSLRALQMRQDAIPAFTRGRARQLRLFLLELLNFLRAAGFLGLSLGESLAQFSLLLAWLLHVGRSFLP